MPAEEQKFSDFGLFAVLQPHLSQGDVRSAEPEPSCGRQVLTIPLRGLGSNYSSPGLLVFRASQLAWVRALRAP